MAGQKREFPHTGRTPKVRGEGESESKVITIPMGVAERLGLVAGEEPEEISYDPEAREVSFQFEE